MLFPRLCSDGVGDAKPGKNYDIPDSEILSLGIGPMDGIWGTLNGSGNYIQNDVGMYACECFWKKGLEQHGPVGMSCKPHMSEL